LSFINEVTKDLICKVVYFGPGLSGKTTNVQYIYENAKDDQRGALASLGAENERTLFFDFLPLSIGKLNSFNTRFHIYSIPGQTFYESSRHFILKGVDGIVFVIDSQEQRMDANIESWELLKKGLDQQGYDLDRVPLVFQYNKRDLPDTVSVAELEKTFNGAHRPFTESVASQGKGVMDTLQLITKLIVQDLKN